MCIFLQYRIPWEFPSVLFNIFVSVDIRVSLTQWLYLSMSFLFWQSGFLYLYKSGHTHFHCSLPLLLYHIAFRFSSFSPVKPFHSLSIHWVITTWDPWCDVIFFFLLNPLLSCKKIVGTSSLLDGKQMTTLGCQFLWPPDMCNKIRYIFLQQILWRVSSQGCGFKWLVYNFIFHLWLEPGTLTGIGDQHNQEQSVQMSSTELKGER